MARSATLDMTQGSLGRQIIGFSLPLMFTNLLQMLFSMVDLAVVGRFSSSAAMGSVGSTTTLIFLFTGFLMGLGSGVNVLVATHFGARSEKNVRESVHTSFLVCLIAGFLMLALGLIFARPLLELLNTRDDLIDGAELYLRIYFLGMPAAALYNYGNGVLNAIGDTKTPLIFLSTAGVLNVILDLVFVIGLGMSTDGVALASMISQCVSAGLIILSLARSKDIYGKDKPEREHQKACDQAHEERRVDGLAHILFVARAEVCGDEHVGAAAKTHQKAREQENERCGRADRAHGGRAGKTPDNSKVDHAEEHLQKVGKHQRM